MTDQKEAIQVQPQRSADIDTELWQCENLDTHQMLAKFRQLAENVQCPAHDPHQYELDATKCEEMLLFHDKLNEGLTNDRLSRIQHNIMALNEPELNQ